MDDDPLAFLDRIRAIREKRRLQVTLSSDEDTTGSLLDDDPVAKEYFAKEEDTPSPPKRRREKPEPLRRSHLQRVYKASVDILPLCNSTPKPGSYVIKTHAPKLSPIQREEAAGDGAIKSPVVVIERNKSLDEKLSPIQRDEAAGDGEKKSSFVVIERNKPLDESIRAQSIILGANKNAGRDAFYERKEEIDETRRTGGDRSRSAKSRSKEPETQKTISARDFRRLETIFDEDVQKKSKVCIVEEIAAKEVGKRKGIVKGKSKNGAHILDKPRLERPGKLERNEPIASQENESSVSDGWEDVEDSDYSSDAEDEAKAGTRSKHVGKVERATSKLKPVQIIKIQDITVAEAPSAVGNNKLRTTESDGPKEKQKKSKLEHSTLIKPNYSPMDKTREISTSTTLGLEYPRDARRTKALQAKSKLNHTTQTTPNCAPLDRTGATLRTHTTSNKTRVMSTNTAPGLEHPRDARRPKALLTQSKLDPTQMTTDYAPLSETKTASTDTTPSLKLELSTRLIPNNVQLNKTRATSTNTTIGSDRTRATPALDRTRATPGLDRLLDVRRSKAFGEVEVATAHLNKRQTVSTNTSPGLQAITSLMRKRREEKAAVLLAKTPTRSFSTSPMTRDVALSSNTLEGSDQESVFEKDDPQDEDAQIEVDDVEGDHQIDDAQVDDDVHVEGDQQSDVDGDAQVDVEGDQQSDVDDAQVDKDAQVVADQPIDHDVQGDNAAQVNDAAQGIAGDAQVNDNDAPGVYDATQGVEEDAQVDDNDPQGVYDATQSIEADAQVDDNDAQGVYDATQNVEEDAQVDDNDAQGVYDAIQGVEEDAQVDDNVAQVVYDATQGIEKDAQVNDNDAQVDTQFEQIVDDARVEDDAQIELDLQIDDDDVDDNDQMDDDDNQIDPRLISIARSSNSIKASDLIKTSNSIKYRPVSSTKKDFPSSEHKRNTEDPVETKRDKCNSKINRMVEEASVSKKKKEMVEDVEEASVKKKRGGTVEDFEEASLSKEKKGKVKDIEEASVKKKRGGTVEDVEGASLNKEKKRKVKDIEEASVSKKTTKGKVKDIEEPSVSNKKKGTLKDLEETPINKEKKGNAEDIGETSVISKRMGKDETTESHVDASSTSKAGKHIKKVKEASVSKKKETFEDIDEASVISQQIRNDEDSESQGGAPSTSKKRKHKEKVDEASVSKRKETFEDIDEDAESQEDAPSASSKGKHREKVKEASVSKVKKTFEDIEKAFIISQQIGNYEDAESRGEASSTNKKAKHTSIEQAASSRKERVQRSKTKEKKGKDDESVDTVTGNKPVKKRQRAASQRTTSTLSCDTAERRGIFKNCRDKLSKKEMDVINYFTAPTFAAGTSRYNRVRKPVQTGVLVLIDKDEELTLHSATRSKKTDSTKTARKPAKKAKRNDEPAKRPAAESTSPNTELSLEAESRDLVSELILHEEDDGEPRMKISKATPGQEHGAEESTTPSKNKKKTGGKKTASKTNKKTGWGKTASKTNKETERRSPTELQVDSVAEKPVSDATPPKKRNVEPQVDTVPEEPVSIATPLKKRNVDTVAEEPASIATPLKKRNVEPQVGSVAEEPVSIATPLKKRNADTVSEGRVSIGTPLKKRSVTEEPVSIATPLKKRNADIVAEEPVSIATPLIKRNVEAQVGSVAGKPASDATPPSKRDVEPRVNTATRLRSPEINDVIQIAEDIGCDSSRTTDAFELSDNFELAELPLESASSAPESNKDGVRSNKIICRVGGELRSIAWASSDETAFTYEITPSVVATNLMRSSTETAGILEIKEGGSMPWCRCTTFEVTYVVLESSAKVRLPETYTIIKPYNMFIIPRGMPFSIQNLSETEKLLMHFNKYEETRLL